MNRENRLGNFFYCPNWQPNKAGLGFGDYWQIRVSSFFDLEIGERIYIDKDEFYNPTPIFLIKTQR